MSATEIAKFHQLKKQERSRGVHGMILSGFPRLFALAMLLLLGLVCADRYLHKKSGNTYTKFGLVWSRRLHKTLYIAMKQSVLSASNEWTGAASCI